MADGSAPPVDQPDLDSRLRTHLDQVADISPRPGLEGRVLTAATNPKRPPSAVSLRPMIAVLVMVGVIAILLVLTVSGHVAHPPPSNNVTHQTPP